LLTIIEKLKKLNPSKLGLTSVCDFAGDPFGEIPSKPKLGGQNRPLVVFKVLYQPQSKAGKSGI